MKQRQMTAVAVGCGLACAVCVAAFMASVQGQADAARAEALARYGGEQVEVCVATRDIAAGERVELSAVETKLWVADLLPEDAVRANGDAVGKVATSSILKGEVVSAKRFENARDALDVPVGKQAVSVPAKAVQAVGGAIRPGMSVDVYASGDTTTSAIALSVLVLAASVGDSGSLASSGSGWITLAVAPEKVQEIIAASTKTSLYFVLPSDQGEGSSQAVDQPDLAEQHSLEDGGQSAFPSDFDPFEQSRQSAIAVQGASGHEAPSAESTASSASSGAASEGGDAR